MDKIPMVNWSLKSYTCIIIWYVTSTTTLICTYIYSFTHCLYQCLLNIVKGALESSMFAYFINTDWFKSTSKICNKNYLHVLTLQTNLYFSRNLFSFNHTIWVDCLPTLYTCWPFDKIKEGTLADKESSLS